MNTYFVLYRIPVASMDEWRKNTPAGVMKEQTAKMMAAINSWHEKHKDAIVSAGTPLGKTKTVTAAGITDSRNDLNYSMVVRAESHDAAAKLFADHPHLTIPTSSIDIMEIPHVGM